MDKPIKLENPLWEFALSLWENEFVRSTLMDWQEECQVRVNACIAALWLAKQGIDDVNILSNAIEESSHWHESKVLPLRKIKVELSGNDSTKVFRDKVLEAEILAEQLELQSIYNDLASAEQNKLDPSPNSDRQNHCAQVLILEILGEQQHKKEADKISQVIASGLGSC